MWLISLVILLQWHGLSREEQAKYYDQARKERQLHMQMYPGWSARDNYAQSKKKKRKRESETSKFASRENFSWSQCMVPNIRFIPQHQLSVYQEYTNFITDLTKVYKSNLCFDPKKILQIDEIEYTNTSFALKYCIQISLLFWSLVYTNFTSVLNSKIRKKCIQIDPLTCRQIYLYTNFSPPLSWGHPAAV